jgi:hypothetical protein
VASGNALTSAKQTRGCGAAGSAPAWHAGGQGFESPQLHFFVSFFISPFFRCFPPSGVLPHLERRPASPRAASCLTSSGVPPQVLMNDGQNHCFDAHHRVVCILRVLHEAGSFVLSMLWGVHTRNMSKHLRRNRSITHLAVGSLLAAGFLVAVMAPANASQVKSCGPGAIAVSGFEKNSEMTGENAVFVVLRNRSAVACSLQGSYPKALLYDSGQASAFLVQVGRRPLRQSQTPDNACCPVGRKSVRHARPLPVRHQDHPICASPSSHPSRNCRSTLGDPSHVGCLRLLRCR